MKLTLADIKTYQDITNKIDTLVRAYYNEFIQCDDTYELNRWEILNDKQIRIIYSYIDYLDNSECNDIILTIDEFNSDMEEFENYNNIRGHFFNIFRFRDYYTFDEYQKMLMGASLAYHNQELMGRIIPNDNPRAIDVNRYLKMNNVAIQYHPQHGMVLCDLNNNRNYEFKMDRI